jgi:hypothetical protein
MMHYDEIMSFTRNLLLPKIAPGEVSSKSGKTMEDVETILRQTENLLDLLYVINDVMTRMEIQDEETITQFQIDCERYGQLTRLYFGGEIASPKLHMLETHCGERLRSFGRIGPYREDPVEKEHQIRKREKFKIANIRNFLQGETFIETNRAAQDLPAVSAQVQSVYSASKRAFTEQSLQKAEGKHAVKKEAKDARFTKARLVT